MSQMSQVKRAMITAVCIALCVVLPMAFHSIQNAGAIFLPDAYSGTAVRSAGGLALWSAVRSGWSAVIQPADRYACDGLSALYDGGAWRVWSALRSVYEICAHRKNLCGSVHQPCRRFGDRSCDRRSV